MVPKLGQAHCETINGAKMTELWERYREALARAGLSSSDALTLVHQARDKPARLGRDPPLVLPLLHRHLDGAAFSTLLDATVDAQARGPLSQPARSVWRLLFVEGCPLDHLWKVLFHAFKDPETDPQDWVTVAPDVALAEARYYSALQFPRASGPWPGLGCQNTLACVRHRIESFAAAESLAAFHGLAELVKLRAVVSPRLCAVLDAQARLDRELPRALDASNTIELAPELFVWSDKRTRAEVFDVARRWIQTLENQLRETRAIHDVSGDRFVSPDEPLGSARPPHRAEPSRPDDRREALRELIAPWDSAWSPPWDKGADSLDALLERRDWEDPLEWLHAVAERALSPPLEK
jgi:hypothetical protein